MVAGSRVTVIGDSAIWEERNMSNAIKSEIRILYATREGHTEKIATRFANELRLQGCNVAVQDVRREAVSIVLMGS